MIMHMLEWSQRATGQLDIRIQQKTRSGSLIQTAAPCPAGEVACPRAIRVKVVVFFLFCLFFKQTLCECNAFILVIVPLLRGTARVQSWSLHEVQALSYLQYWREGRQAVCPPSCALALRQ